MGVVRREKRRRLRAMEKAKPMLYKMLDETEYIIRAAHKNGDEPEQCDLEIMANVITDFNSQWRHICKRHNMIEVLSAYNDGVSMINSKLKHEREKKRKVGEK